MNGMPSGFTTTGKILALTLLLLGGASAPLSAGDRVIERVVTIVKEPKKTTKSITLDGELVFFKIWYTDGRHEGPGAIRPEALGGSAPRARPRPATTKPRSRRPTRPVATRPRRGRTSRPSSPRNAPPPHGRPRKVPAPSAGTKRLEGHEVFRQLAALEGVPYKKGRSARSGSSCAGFTALALRIFGLHADETSIPAQARMGKAVSRGALRLGDLVFFSNSPGKKTPDFGGIALSNGEMIYMSFKAGKAVRKDISSTWWRQAFVGARRVVELDGRSRFVVTPPTPVPQTPSNARVQRGQASFYGLNDGFHQSGTASGERYDRDAMTAAHKTLPMDSLVRVRNERNGRTVEVRINDRGPYVEGRIIDLSVAAAKKLDMISAGVVPCTVEVLRYGDGSR